MEGGGAFSDLVNQLSAVGVFWREDSAPEVWVLSPHEVAGLTLEQGVLVAHLRKEEGGENGKE